jgi:hypothetical protein
LKSLRFSFFYDLPTALPAMTLIGDIRQ